MGEEGEAYLAIEALFRLLEPYFATALEDRAIGRGERGVVPPQISRRH